MLMQAIAFKNFPHVFGSQLFVKFNRWLKPNGNEEIAENDADHCGFEPKADRYV